MKCNNCGTELGNGEKVCASCGVSATQNINNNVDSNIDNGVVIFLSCLDLFMYLLNRKY